MVVHDMLIVGGGPAGLTAAIYAGRAQLNVIMLERQMTGGQVISSDLIENYPGFQNGVGGTELMTQMENQAKRFGLQVISDDVQDADLFSIPKKIIGSNGTYYAVTVILATGTMHKSLNVPGEKEFFGRGVSYCATCDGPLPFFRDKDVVVVGGGSSGIQESLFLARFVRSIQLVEMADKLSAERILQQRARQNPKFSFFLNTKVVSINGNKMVESVTVQQTCSREKQELKANGIFIWVGLTPNTQFLKESLPLDRWGYIQTNERLETSIPGIYAAGDVRAKEIRQITTAVGDGTIAAESAIHHLETRKL